MDVSAKAKEIAEQLLDVDWIGDSKERLMAFPEDVQDGIGYALHRAQEKKKSNKIKIMTGLGKGISGVIEIVDDYDGDTYRAVYTVKFGNVICVLHTFQKKSKSGIETPKKEIATIKKRYKEARQKYK